MYCNSTINMYGNNWILFIQMLCIQIQSHFMSGYPRSEVESKKVGRIEVLSESEIEKMKVTCKVCIFVCFHFTRPLSTNILYIHLYLNTIYMNLFQLSLYISWSLMFEDLHTRPSQGLMLSQN